MDKLEKALEKARRQRTETATPLRAVAPQPFAAPGGAVTLDEPRLEGNRIVAHHARSASADIFRLLRAQVLQNMGKIGARTLAVTSPNYGDGKTTVAINLAVSIAQDLKQTVLLVDLDLRKPCVHSYLGIEAVRGLTDYLNGTSDLVSGLVRLPFERMSVLPAGAVHDRSSELLGSPQMAALAEELKNRYPDRVIIYDMPPLLAQDDPIAFLPHVDSLLLVVQEGVTREDEIKRSLEVLDTDKVIGTVLNRKF